MPSDQTRILIIVPAWNEEAVIGSVLAELDTVLRGSADILVVSDGSRDATAEIAREAGVKVLDLAVNQGVGGAMRAGYLYAQREGYDFAIQVDADGQHDPREIATLVECQAETGADLVIGARFAGKGDYRVRGPRWWAMKLLSFTLSRVVGTQLTDTTSGFKLCGRNAIRLFAQEYPAEYLGDTIEALVIAKKHDLMIRQVAVEMRPRAGGEPSHNPYLAAKFLMRAFIAFGIALSRPRVENLSGKDA